MKKIFLTFAIVMMSLSSFAQSAAPKTPAEAKAAVESALADSQNEKKSSKVQTWIKLGQAYLNAYSCGQGNGVIGSSMDEVNLMMAKNKYSIEKTVKFGDNEFLMRKYWTADYYFKNNRLTFIDITRPVVTDPLKKAYKAYCQAQTLDVKGKSKKDLTAALTNIVDKVAQEAVMAYNFNKMIEAAQLFEFQYEVSNSAPLCVVDSNAVYNSGFTAFLAKDYDYAEQQFKKCIDIKYYGANGAVYSKLAEIATLKNNGEAAKNYLEEGFAKFPESEFILVGLINYYVTSGENSDRIFVLLDKVKAKDPSNPSLYSVEGDIHEKLGQIDAAIASWRKSVEVDPKYAQGYFAEGYYYLKESDKIAEEATALPANEWKKYDEMVLKYNQKLKQSLPLLIKAYELEADGVRKNAYAGLIKNASFRLRQEEEYKAIYEKYKELYKE